VIQIFGIYVILVICSYYFFIIIIIVLFSWSDFVSMFVSFLFFSFHPFKSFNIIVFFFFVLFIFTILLFVIYFYILCIIFFFSFFFFNNYVPITKISFVMIFFVDYINDFFIFVLMSSMEIRSKWKSYIIFDMLIFYQCIIFLFKLCIMIR